MKPWLHCIRVELLHSRMKAQKGVGVDSYCGDNMKAVVSLATRRAVPNAIEYIKPKDLKKIPKDIADARKLWESGDQAGAKKVLLKYLRATIGEPFDGGDDLSKTGPNALKPSFELRDVWWTEHALPDVSIAMTLPLELREGVDLKSATAAVLQIANDEYAAKELFGQTVGIDWQFDETSYSLASEEWEFSMSKG